MLTFIRYIEVYFTFAFLDRVNLTPNSSFNFFPFPVALSSFKYP